MLSLSGFELYSRWVPLISYIISSLINNNNNNNNLKT